MLIDTVPATTARLGGAVREGNVTGCEMGESLRCLEFFRSTGAITIGTVAATYRLEGAIAAGAIGIGWLTSPDLMHILPINLIIS